jgi:hypothetical protein
MRKITFGLIIASLAVGTAAQADLGIDARQADQQRQIDAGKRSGKLSRRERVVLTNEQKQIKLVEARLRVRGNNLGERDEARLNAMLDRAQRNINQMKNNRERGRTGIHL